MLGDDEESTSGLISLTARNESLLRNMDLVGHVALKMRTIKWP